MISPDGGAPIHVDAKFDLSIGTPVWAPDGHTIYFSTNVLEAIEVFKTAAVPDSMTKEVWQLGGSIGITEISRTISSAQQPAEIYISKNGDYPQIITHQNAWLNDYSLAQSEVVKWKSKDGTEIEGVLTKPAGYEAGKKVPLLLNPHGGPTGASINSWNGTVQVLAANGFAVLQPNFRGSTGKGLAFSQANKNTWGKGDYEDCMSGVDTMIANGLADPDRLGAFGWSYGT